MSNPEAVINPFVKEALMDLAAEKFVYPLVIYYTLVALRVNGRPSLRPSQNERLEGMRQTYLGSLDQVEEAYPGINREVLVGLATPQAARLIGPHIFETAANWDRIGTDDRKRKSFEEFFIGQRERELIVRAKSFQFRPVK